MVEFPVCERQLLGLTLAELDPRRELRAAERTARPAQHVRALIHAHDGAAVALDQGPRHEAGAGGDVQDPVTGAGADPRDHLTPPARVLPEAEAGGEHVVAPIESGEERQRAALAFRGSHGWMTASQNGPLTGRAHLPGCENVSNTTFR
jgi:hypothetical protein